MSALAESVLSAGMRGPGAAVADKWGSLARADLRACADDLGEAFRRVSSGPAPLVAAVLPLGVDAVRVLLTAVVHDLRVVFLDPAWPQDRQRAVLDEVQPDVLVEPSGIRAGRDSGVIPGGHDPDAGPAGYLAMSSGSTGGRPKGVLAGWDGVARFVEAGAAALDLDHTGVWAEATHLSYDMSMTNILTSLAAGARIALGSTSDNLRPLRFAARTGATHLRVAPRTVDLAVAERRAAHPDLRVWGSGGDRLMTRHLTALRDLGIPTVVNTYGTSETIGFASAARINPADPPDDHLGAVTIGPGQVGDWSLDLHDIDDLPMVRIHSPVIPGGYAFGGPSEGGYPVWVSPGTVVSGDVGAAGGGGYFCLGRAGRKVKRNGLFVDLDQIDQDIVDRFDVPSHTVALVDGTLITLVEADASTSRVLQVSLPSFLPPDRVPARLVHVASIPRLANGKVDQRAARDLAADVNPV